MKSDITNDIPLFENIRDLIKKSRELVLSNINYIMLYTYFEIGRMIIEIDQQGKSRAHYSEKTIVILSEKLTHEFGKGFSAYNLERMRKFYYIFKNRIPASMMRESEFPFKLSWTHYLILIKIDNDDERDFYEIEAFNQNWTVRELQRQFNSSLYERLVLSKDKKKVKELSSKGQIIEKPADLVKEPYIFEFLGLKDEVDFSENDLEKAIINKFNLWWLLKLLKNVEQQGRII